MAVRLADKIKQSNDADFFLLDAEDVEMANGKSLEEEIAKLKENSGSGGSTSLDDWKTTNVTKYLDTTSSVREFDDVTYTVNGKIKMVFVVTTYDGLSLCAAYTKTGTYTDAGYLEELVINDNSITMKSGHYYANSELSFSASILYEEV